MPRTLKNIIEHYNTEKLNTPNVQIINERLSNEIINLPDGVLLDLTFSRSFFDRSSLTKIKFCNGSFNLSFFKDCVLENCVFSNIHFQ